MRNLQFGKVLGVGGISPMVSLLAALIGVNQSAVLALPNPTDVIPAKGGAIKITPIYHASVQIEYGGKVIQVDPFSAGDYTGAKKADIILITHNHPDHLDLKAIAAVRKSSTRFIMPEAVFKSPGVDKVVPDPGTVVLGNGNTAKIDAISILAVPSYNLVRGPKPGQKFHPKGQFDGYVLTLGDKHVYIAGDTEATPEMKSLKGIDVAFLPMNLPFTMTPQEAAVAAKAFKPKVVYPYHYRYPFDKANNNPQVFAEGVKGSGIEVRMRGWYAHPSS